MGSYLRDNTSFPKVHWRRGRGAFGVMEKTSGRRRTKEESGDGSTYLETLEGGDLTKKEGEINGLRRSRKPRVGDVMEEVLQEELKDYPV